VRYVNITIYYLWVEIIGFGKNGVSIIYFNNMFTVLRNLQIMDNNTNSGLHNMLMEHFNLKTYFNIIISLIYIFGSKK